MTRRPQSGLRQFADRGVSGVSLRNLVRDLYIANIVEP